MIVVGTMNWSKVPYDPAEVSDRSRIDAIFCDQLRNASIGLPTANTEDATAEI